MKSIVVYDTNYGSTKAIAEAIAAAEGVNAIFVGDLKQEMLKGLRSIVVGSPIIGWRPSERMASFLLGLGDKDLQGVKAATFDTRVKLFIHGDAKDQIAAALVKAGATIAAPSTAFYVKGREGVLFEGEIERAKDWGKKLKQALN